MDSVWRKEEKERDQVETELEYTEEYIKRLFGDKYLNTTAGYEWNCIFNWKSMAFKFTRRKKMIFFFKFLIRFFKFFIDKKKGWLIVCLHHFTILKIDLFFVETSRVNSHTSFAVGKKKNIIYFIALISVFFFFFSSSSR